MKKSTLFFALVLFIVLPSFSQNLKVQYLCGDTTVFNYKIRPFISIVNEGSAAVNLSGLTVRYYYTKEGYVAQKLTIDWSPVQGVTGTFYDGYLQVGFGSGSLAAGSATGAIQLRMEKNGGGYFDQADDYSFDPDITTLTDYPKITLYQNGTLIWGVEPPSAPEPTPPPPADDDWLHTDGSTIRDRFGNTVRLTGINWFGFETDVNGFYNFDKVNWRFALETMTDLGFNLLRIPLSATLVNEWRGGADPAVNHINGEVNWDIDGVTSLVFLDLVIDYCKSLGMKIMFDIHGIARSQNEATWLSGTSAGALQNAWRWLAARYKNEDTIIAADLFNEPHGTAFGNSSAGAKWDGSSDAHNWRKAAQDTAAIILAENPNWLIMVEGIECYPKPGYTYASTDKYTYDYNWWGGNLRGVVDYPVNLGSYQNKLVYSPHDYGPDIYQQEWFKNGFDLAKLTEQCWDPNWFYIVRQNTAPVLIGEWGGKLANADNKKWLQLLAQFITQQNLHHTFWAFNPNSGDTGGIMLDDWNTVDQAKYAIVEPALWKGGGKYIGLDHKVNLGKSGKGTNVGSYYGATTVTPPTPTVRPTPTATHMPTRTSGPYAGDVNGNGQVDIIDALMTAQYYVGLNPAGFIQTAADVNGDGQITIVDALMIAQYYVGLIPGF